MGVRNDEEAEKLRRQDLAIAQSLSLRAEGHEKVDTSMLEQPPLIHPIDDDDITTPAISPKLKPSRHPHTLPNGVRMRLPLGTIFFGVERMSHQAEKVGAPSLLSSDPRPLVIFNSPRL